MTRLAKAQAQVLSSSQTITRMATGRLQIASLRSLASFHEPVVVTLSVGASIGRDSLWYN